MSLTIIPSIGRKVWLFLNAAQLEPIDATIVKVHEAPDVATPTSICNLSAILPDDGAHRFFHAVQASEDPIDAVHFRWMPYQTGQAAKAAEPGPDLSNLAMRVDALEARTGELARYVDLPTEEDRATADQWPDVAQQSLSSGVDTPSGVTLGSSEGTAAANDGPTEAPQTATDTGETPAS